MSYILEALRKAERERNLGQVPTLEGGGSEQTEEETRRLWPWLVGAALLINAVVLALWLFPPHGPKTFPDVAEVESRPPLPPPPAPEPAVADYLPPPTTVVEAPISEPPVVTVPRPTPEPEPVPASVDDPPVTLAIDEAAPSTPDDAAQDLFVGEDEIVEETPVAQDVSALRDMPPEFRRSLPQMKMDAHFYTTVPGRSFVMINLTKYKTGDRMTEGPQVEEIVSDGVILSYQGQQFLLTP